jgi:hypothetical protein
MIKVTQTRDRDGEHFVQPTLSFSEPLEAVIHLAKAELSWGGKIVGFSEMHIEVHTKVMQCHDTSIFEGSSDEMRPLCELVRFYLEGSERHGDLIASNIADSLLHNEVGGVPLFISMMAPLLVGGNRLRVAVMLACGVVNKDDIEAGLGARIEDLVSAFQLSKDGLCSFRDALSA